MFFTPGAGPAAMTGMTVNQITNRNRLIGESRIFLTKTNTKWVSVGVSCTPKAAFPNDPGFKLTAQIMAENARPMEIGDVREAKAMFKALKEDDELACFSPETASNYEDLNDLNLFMISKTNYKQRLVQIMNSRGEHTTCALPTIEDLLRREKIILAKLRCMEGSAARCETLFNSMVKKASINYDKTIEETEAEGDSMAVDIISNFVECFDLCVNIAKTGPAMQNLVDEKIAQSGVSPPPAKQARKEKK